MRQLRPPSPPGAHRGDLVRARQGLPETLLITDVNIYKYI